MVYVALGMDLLCLPNPPHAPAGADPQALSHQRPQSHGVKTLI